MFPDVSMRADLRSLGNPAAGRGGGPFRCIARAIPLLLALAAILGPWG